MSDCETAPLLRYHNTTHVDSHVQNTYVSVSPSVMNAEEELVTTKLEKDSVEDKEKEPVVDIDILTTSGTHIICQSIDLSKQDVSSRTTNLECLMHLLKGMIGTGILAMPVAFKNGGLWVSLGTTFIIGIICTECMHMLVKSRNKLCEVTGDLNLDYAGVIEKAFEQKGDPLKKYSSLARSSVNTFLLITQIGFCCVYIVFVSQNVEQVIEQLSSIQLNGNLYIVFITILLVPYVMVKSLKTLAPFSAFANLLNCVGLIIILVDLFQGFGKLSDTPAFSGFSSLPLFFGQVIFSFEGIGLVLPLHSKMKEREAFLGRVGVLNLGLVITICLYNAVGFYGYLRYGDQVLGSITLNLPLDNWLFLCVKLMFALSIFISYGLQFYVPANIIWPFITEKCRKRGYNVPVRIEYAFRLVMLWFTCGLATLVPHLDLLISLVGALASSFLALVIPSVIELATFQSTWVLRTKCIFIITLGLLGFITGTYSSLLEIIKSF